MKRARMMLVTSMVIFGTIGLFKRFVPVTSGELALYRAVLAAVLLVGVLLVTRQKIPFKAIGSKQVHKFPLTAIAEKGHHTPAPPLGQLQSRFLTDFSQQTFLRAFLPLKFATDADPFILVDVIFLFHPMEHQHIVTSSDIAQRRVDHNSILLKQLQGMMEHFNLHLLISAAPFAVQRPDHIRAGGNTNLGSR